MAFSVSTFAAPGAQSLDATIYALDDGAGGRAEVWPALGFNCYRWCVVKNGQPKEMLYADPSLFSDGRPTRSGIPILFPFPNRIRAGRFEWEGKNYQLPLNDAPKLNAIHGFACRRAWRVVDHGADGSAAWVTGEFHGQRDAADCQSLWPADYVVRVTYRLGAGSLRLHAEVRNPDSRALPFGLGYHPYFRAPFTAGAALDDCTVTVPAHSYWELQDSLPTGQCKLVDVGRNLNALRRIGDLNLDDVLTGLPAANDALPERGRITGAAGMALRLACSPSFREMVVFTPSHRQAFCIEPYTCATDAINLQARGIGAGWLALPPGGRWTGEVEMKI